MPRPAGESGKVGNDYEAVWTVEVAIDVFVERFRSITVEAFDEKSRGVEFHVETDDHKLQFHSVKRQKQGGDWSVADLCRAQDPSGRSILGDLIRKSREFPGAESRFVSSTGANELRELTERARTPTSASEFRTILSAKLQDEFDRRIVPLCGSDPDAALSALKSLEIIPRGHRELIRSVERRIDELFYRIDGSSLRADDVRRMISDFILGNLGAQIDRKRLAELFQEKRIGVRNWKTDATVNSTVDAINERYLSVTEAELVNSAQIAREAVGQIVGTLSEAASRAVLVVGPAGFGKSCVLAQCLSRLASSGIRFICLRMDSFTPCGTARQLGAQIDLPASPAIVLAGLADNTPCVLVIDQLDAMSLVSGRNPQMWEVFRELSEEAQTYPNMKMLLACTELMRTVAADVYARNLSHAVIGDKCAEQLKTFFTDESELVRKQVSRAFFHLSGERLLQLTELIAQFIESRCFESETNCILHSLAESNVRLPHIICRAAERILEFLGEEGTHVAYHGSMVAHDISMLVVRQYEQSTDELIKIHCLNLIDRMAKIGYLGISDELNRVDR
jgi:hypothetical protein